MCLSDTPEAAWRSDATARDVARTAAATGPGTRKCVRASARRGRAGEIGTERGYAVQHDSQPMTLNEFSAWCHRANARWWLDLSRPCRACHGASARHGDVHCENCSDLGYEQKTDRNVGELLMLCVSELSEAMEGHRKDLADDKLPHRKMFEVELADLLIRVFDLAGGLGLDIGGAFEEKMEYNQHRDDHQITNRLKAGGKKY